MSEVNDRFVDRLVERADWLTPLLQDHLADNFGEVLPHVFLGEVTRQLVAHVLDGRQVELPVASAEVHELLTLLEAEFTAGDEEVDELIAVSFLENLPPEGAPGDELRSLLGPALTRQLARIV